MARAARRASSPASSVPQHRGASTSPRSEEHTSELQSQSNLVCRLLLEKKKNIYSKQPSPTQSNSTCRCLVIVPVTSSHLFLLCYGEVHQYDSYSRSLSPRPAYQSSPYC